MNCAGHYTARVFSTLEPYNRRMRRWLLRHVWFVIPLALAIFFLPNWIMRAWLPLPGSLPTPTAAPTLSPFETTFEQGLELAASDPLAAVPLLQEVAFSASPRADAARSLVQAIQAARLANDPAYTLTASGQALAAIGEWRLARLALLRAVELAPNYAEAWAYLGEAQQQNGEYGLPALLRAVELDPRSISARLFTAFYWQRHGDFVEADQNLAVASRLSPLDPMIRIQWGQNSVLKGDAPEALEHFQKALDLSPQNPIVWRALANYSVQTELYVAEVGLPSAQRLVTAFPKDVEALVLNARAYALVDKPATADVFFNLALEQDSQFAPAHLYYGIFLLANGDAETARLHFNQVLALVPESAEAELAAYWLEQTSH